MLGPGPLVSKAGSGDGRSGSAESGMGPPGILAGPPVSKVARRPAWFALGSPLTLWFRFPGANLGPGFSRLAARRPAWFALDSPLALCFRFPGANLGPGIWGLEARRPAFSRCGLLPPPRKPLQLRSGEQILHTISAPPPETGRRFQGAVCSTLPASPCGTVPGSKFFTQFPRLRPVPASFSMPRFAPPSPRTLEVPFRGANSSHKFRADARGRPAFPRRGLLPAPREPLQFRSGEQILHTISAPQARTRRSRARTALRRRTKSTLPVYRQGASLSPTVPPRACTVSCRSPAGQYSPRGSQSRGALLIN